MCYCLNIGSLELRYIKYRNRTGRSIDWVCVRVPARGENGKDRSRRPRQSSVAVAVDLGLGRGIPSVPGSLRSKSKANNTVNKLAVRILTAFSQFICIIVSSSQLIHGLFVSLTYFLVLVPKLAISL